MSSNDSPTTEPVANSPVARGNDPANTADDDSQTPRIPSLRSISDPPLASSMTTSSTPLGTIAAARGPARPAASVKGFNSDVQAKLKAFAQSRQGAPPIVQQPSSPNLNVNGSLAPGMGALRLDPAGRPQPHNWNSAPSVPGARRGPKPSLGARRGLALPGGLPGSSPLQSAVGSQSPVDGKGEMQKLNGLPPAKPHNPQASLFEKYSEFVDTEKGTLKFAGKAIIHGNGVDFSSGNSFSISLDEVDTLDELGKGNYGTVYKVRHSRPRVRIPGKGLAGNKASAQFAPPPSAKTQSRANGSQDSLQEALVNGSKTTGAIMAMKEIRLELDEAKFAAIIMELDILHRCISPFIIDFYGAFFQEGAVYICMEFMDGGSIDKLYKGGMPESVLQKVTLSAVLGLKALKEEHNIIHRDVKPTNILVNTNGQIKLCDFGVSGNLVASFAKTNIGCQSYMAPERITSGGMMQSGAPGGSYSVQSDIWSLGLTIIEGAMGQYPYPPETYNNIFSQLSAIVDGDPPDLPKDGFGDLSRDFVRGCLHKIPKLRPTYAMLLQHGWLAQLWSKEGPDGKADTSADPAEFFREFSKGDPEVAAWVKGAIERRSHAGDEKTEKPALHAAPLDAVSSPGSNPDSLELKA